MFFSQLTAKCIQKPNKCEWFDSTKKLGKWKNDKVLFVTFISAEITKLRVNICNILYQQQVNQTTSVSASNLLQKKFYLSSYSDTTRSMDRYITIEFNVVSLNSMSNSYYLTVDSSFKHMG